MTNPALACVPQNLDQHVRNTTLAEPACLLEKLCEGGPTLLARGVRVNSICLVQWGENAKADRRKNGRLKQCTNDIAEGA
jgi:hypothetical protein